MTSPNRPAPRQFPVLALAFALGVGTCVLGFAFGRWSAATPAPAGAAAADAASIRAEVARAVAEAVARQAPTLPGAPLAAIPALAAAAEPPPAARAPQVPAPEVVARAREDAHGEIEALRGYITTKCGPAAGVAGGRSSKVVFNLTFDASGHEIARGVGEDRRAPAGAFGACLRRLPGNQLTIPPPGTTVSFSIPFTFP